MRALLSGPASLNVCLGFAVALAISLLCRGAEAQTTLASAPVAEPSRPVSAPASPPPTAERKSIDQCIDHHRLGQTLRREGRHGAANVELKSCLDPNCSPLLREACARLINEVEAEAPSIVLKVTSRGRDLLNVAVYDNETLLVEKLDGTPQQLDPGQHRLRFEAQGMQPAEQVVILRIGEQKRVVAVDLEPVLGEPVARAAAPAAPVNPASVRASRPASVARPAPTARAGLPTSSSHSRFWDYGLLGSAAAFATAGAVVGLLAWDDGNNAEKTCNPLCSDARITRIKTKAAIADGLYVLAAAAATWGTIRLLSAKDEKAARATLLISPGYVGTEVLF